MKNSHDLWYAALLLSGLILFAGCEKKPTASEQTPNADEQSLLKSGDDNDVSGAQVPFAFQYMWIEYNSTADDAGIQVYFDAEAWKRVKILGTDNKEILEFEADRNFEELGLTELRFESAEPSPSETLALFPAGSYKFAGRTLKGDRLVGSAMLSHDLPAAPVFSPSNGELVDRNNTIIKWNPIPGIASYQVTVSNDALGVVMAVDLLASVTSLQVPPTFLTPNTKYNAEVLAISPNRNTTITEGIFTTLP